MDRFLQLQQHIFDLVHRRLQRRKSTVRVPSTARRLFQDPKARPGVEPRAGSGWNRAEARRSCQDSRWIGFDAECHLWCYRGLCAGTASADRKCPRRRDLLRSKGTVRRIRTTIARCSRARFQRFAITEKRQLWAMTSRRYLNVVRMDIRRPGFARSLRCAAQTGSS